MLLCVILQAHAKNLAACGGGRDVVLSCKGQGVKQSHRECVLPSQSSRNEKGSTSSPVCSLPAHLLSPWTALESIQRAKDHTEPEAGMQQGLMSPKRETRCLQEEPAVEGSPRAAKSQCPTEGEGQAGAPKLPLAGLMAQGSRK